MHDHVHNHDHPHTNDHPHGQAQAMSPEETLALLDQPLIELEPWDPLGSLAD